MHNIIIAIVAEILAIISHTNNTVVFLCEKSLAVPAIPREMNITIVPLI